MREPVTTAPPRDRLLAETRALCPRCLGVVPGENLERDGKVILRRTCLDHGTFESMVLSDASWWEWSRRFIRPGRHPAYAATETVHGCPYDCGFCPEHQQHACVTVFEITEACNLECPACFAGDAHVKHVTLEDVGAMADGLIRAEGGQADVAMLSGGEPTLHPRFFEVADAVRARPIRYTIVNSNGIRMARDPVFCEGLAERDMLVYLQFDGFADETYRALRGRTDLLELKQRALENLRAAGVRVVLVATVLDYATNAAMPNVSEAFRRDAEEMREILLKLYSKSAPAGSERQADAFFCACEPLLAEIEGVDDLPDRIFGVTIEGFMDRQSFDLSRAVKCCIQEALPDGRIVPFCVYNTLYRFAPDHRPEPPA